MARRWKVKKRKGVYVVETGGQEAPVSVSNKKIAEQVAKALNRAEKEKEIREKLKEPSDEFVRAYCDTGSTSITCEACGRYHFSAQEERRIYEDNFDEDEAKKEWEDLLARAEAEPDKYFYHAGFRDDYISWGFIDGMQIVGGCPCKTARRYEDWIWGHRYVITDYLKAMARRWIADAKKVADLANIDATMLEKEELKVEGRVRRPTQ